MKKVFFSLVILTLFGELFSTVKIGSPAYGQLDFPEVKPTPTPRVPYTCAQLCAQKGLVGGICRYGQVYRYSPPVCRFYEIYVGEAKDCFIPGGIVGAKCGCCCRFAKKPVPLPTRELSWIK